MLHFHLLWDFGIKQTTNDRVSIQQYRVRWHDSHKPAGIRSNLSKEDTPTACPCGLRKQAASTNMALIRSHSPGVSWTVTVLAELFCSLLLISMTDSAQIINAVIIFLHCILHQTGFSLACPPYTYFAKSLVQCNPNHFKQPLKLISIV